MYYLSNGKYLHNKIILWKKLGNMNYVYSLNCSETYDH